MDHLVVQFPEDLLWFLHNYYNELHSHQQELDCSAAAELFLAFWAQDKTIPTTRVSSFHLQQNAVLVIDFFFDIIWFYYTVDNSHALCIVL